jgi:protein TonB
MEVLKYVKYCLSLFEECTVNGLGTLQFIEAPPEKDINNNLIKKKYYLIAFKSVPLSRPRLTNIIAGKEGCSTEAAIAAIDQFVETIKGQLRQNKEAWLSEIGLLKKQGDDILLMSHKFLVKSFKNSQPGAPAIRKGEGNLIDSSSTDVVVAAALVIPAISVEEKDLIAQEPVSPYKKSSSPSQSNSTTFTAAESSTPSPSFPVEKEAALPSIVPASVSPNITSVKETNKPDESAEPFIKKAERFVKKNLIYIGVFFGLALITLLTTYFFQNDLKSSGNSIAANTTNPSALTNSAENQSITNQPGTLDTPESSAGTVKDKNIVLTVNKDNTNDTDKKKATSAKYDEKKQSTQLDEDASVLPGNKEIVPSPVLQNSNPTVAETKPAIPVIAGTQTTKAETSAGTPIINPPTIEAPKKEDEAAKVVETSIVEPQFPGGQKALQQFIGKVDYPDKALEDGISGHVTVAFTIDENGKVRNPVVTEGLGGGCNESALRIISRMPQWVPATLNGQKVARRKTIRITFTQNDEKRPNPKP